MMENLKREESDRLEYLAEDNRITMQNQVKNSNILVKDFE